MGKKIVAMVAVLALSVVMVGCPAQSPAPTTTTSVKATEGATTTTVKAPVTTTTVAK